jgi:hypothetical protein
MEQKSHQSPEIFVDVAHLTNYGNALVAKNMARKIFDD